MHLSHSNAELIAEVAGLLKKEKEKEPIGAGWEVEDRCGINGTVSVCAGADPLYVVVTRIEDVLDMVVSTEGCTRGSFETSG